MTQFDTRVNIKRLRRTAKSSSTESRALDVRVGIIRPGGSSNRFSARLGAAKLGFMKLGKT